MKLLSSQILKSGNSFLGFRIFGSVQKRIFEDILLKSLMQSQYWPQKTLANHQREMIGKVLSFASSNVPFWNANFRNKNIKSIKPMSKLDFKKIPIEKFLALETNTSNAIKTGTSGSTGVPFQFFIDKRSFLKRRALYKRVLLWGGRRSNDTIIRMLNFDRYGVEKEGVFIPCSGPNELQDKKRIIYSLAEKSRHGVIFDGFASFLLFFARIAEKDKKKFKTSFLISTAEMLGREERLFIEKIFHAPIFNCYVSREAGLIGTECEYHDGFHIHSENILVEILNDQGLPVTEGEVGNITITTFDNFIMPLIRYQLGDKGSFMSKNCPCGRTLPKIRVEGRNFSWITLPKNKTSNIFEILQPLRKRMEHIIQYQIIQKSINKILLLIVPNENFDAKIRNEISAEMRNFLGCEVHFDIREVGSIPTTQGGKQQHFISYLPRETQDLP